MRADPLPTKDESASYAGRTCSHAAYVQLWWGLGMTRQIENAGSITSGIAVADSGLSLAAICRCDLTAQSSRFISADEAVSVGAVDSSNRLSVSSSNSLSSDDSLSLVSNSNGSTMDTVELSTA